MFFITTTAIFSVLEGEAHACFFITATGAGMHNEAMGWVGGNVLTIGTVVASGAGAGAHGALTSDGGVESTKDGLPSSPIVITRAGAFRRPSYISDWFDMMIYADRIVIRTSCAWVYCDYR